MRVLQVLLVVAIGLVVLAVLVRALENSMVFVPAPYPLGSWDPAALGVVGEDVWFRADDGIELHGWYLEAGPRGVGSPSAGSLPAGTDPPAPAGRSEPPVLLWAHGNAGNLTIRAPHAGVLADLGLAVFLFDYRGYGRSEGRPSEDGIYRDAEAAYGYLIGERGVDPGRIVILGRSLGTAPAARLAARVAHAGLILVSPFPSAAAMARRMFFGLPLHLLAKNRFPVAEWVTHRSRPLLVIHGDRDEVVPAALGRAVFAAAAEPKELVVLPGAGHNDILESGGDRYLQAVIEFSRRCVADPEDGHGRQRR